jgi:hypothetical protein
MRLMEASAYVAEVIYGKKNSNSYKACTIRKWLKYYLLYGKKQTYSQGKNAKTSSIITDENIQMRLKMYLRDMNHESRTPEKFINLLNTTVLQLFSNAPTQISIVTARK